MKGLVAYDSVHGNTKLVAEAIAEEIKANGHQVELIPLHKGCGAPTHGDFLFVGSPTRASRMTKDTKAFLENLDVEYWKTRPIVPFDTVGPLSKDPEKRQQWMMTIDAGDKNAGSRIRSLCLERGMNRCEKTLHIAVVGFTGPLAPDALTISREYTKRFLTDMK